MAISVPVRAVWPHLQHFDEAAAENECTVYSGNCDPDVCCARFSCNPKLILDRRSGPPYDQEQTTFPQLPDSIRSNPRWKSSMWIWWVSTLPSGKPVSTICVILYQVSYMRRP